MRKLTILGLILILLGGGALLLDQFSYFEEKPVMGVGPVKVTTQVEHHVASPSLFGIVILLAGAGLIVYGRPAT